MQKVLGGGRRGAGPPWLAAWGVLLLPPSCSGREGALLRKGPAAPSSSDVKSAGREERLGGGRGEGGRGSAVGGVRLDPEAGLGVSAP